jgi:hypothetical protein
MEPRALLMLGNCSTSELHPQPGKRIILLREIPVKNKVGTRERKEGLRFA